MQVYVFQIFIAIALIICFLYSIGIIAATIGWAKTTIYMKNTHKPNTNVSIIVACRNEENNIKICIENLTNQQYPQELYEIILVDDSSSDNTLAIIKQAAAKNNRIRHIELFKLKLLGKKNALNEAIKTAKGELIITTDADCFMGEMWLNEIVCFYEKTGAKMIVSPVMFSNEKNVFEKTQSIEMLALMGTTGGSLFYHIPTMCNGANLAYEKKAFVEVNGFEQINNLPSGDDVLLMHKFSNYFKNSILFLKNKNAIVYTCAQKNLNDFINQRIRWSSKGVKEMSFLPALFSITVYLFNLIMAVSTVLVILFYAQNSVFYPVFTKFCLIIFGIKCIIDFLLLFLASRFFDKTAYLIYFLPLQLLYPFYVSIIGCLSLRKKYKWKERNVYG